MHRIFTLCEIGFTLCNPGHNESHILYREGGMDTFISYSNWLMLRSSGESVSFRSSRIC